MKKFFGNCLTLLILYGIKLSKTEIFTSIVEVEELFETESVIINNFEEYLLVQERKMEYLKLKVQDYKRRRKHQVSGTNVTLYVSNPITDYLLIKSLTSDSIFLQELMYYYNGSSFLENVNNYRNILKIPSLEDLNGAAEALLNVQDIYNLETDSIAKGELNGVHYSTEMTSHDCLLLGVRSSVIGKYSYIVLWMDEAMKRFVSEPRNKINSNTDGPLKIIIGLRDLFYYNKRCISKKPIKTVENESSHDRICNMMCREELKPTSRKLRSLRCHYVTNNVPFLKIAPLKRETVNISPFIVIYHEAIFDNEIELIKEMAKPRLIRAFVTDTVTGSPVIGSFFIAKRALIKAEEYKFMQNFVQRTEDMTGLNIEITQDIEAVNYGIGGHYVPHYDFFEKDDEKVCQGNDNGNRMATVLFYMSDVARGGATVFPAIKTIIFPKKGTAVFWYNLYASGEVDYRTKHSGCPILNGSKWVLNTLIGERGQVFRRPCDIIPDHSTHLEECKVNQ